MMIHCDYSNVPFKPITHQKITKYIGVSKYVCDIFTKLTGINCELSYNPVYIEKPKVEKSKGLNIIYAGRLTSEKQGWLIDKFSETLDKAGIDYKLNIYSNRKANFKSKNIIFHKPNLDITKEMAKASFTLITSKHEAFCLSAVESLIVGTPLICTDLPVFKEIGIDKTNSIKIDESLKDFNPKDLYKKFEFEYILPKDNWNKYLPRNKTYNPNELVEVEVIKRKLWLVAEDKHYKMGDKFKTNQIRASELEAKEFVEIEDPSM